MTNFRASALSIALAAALAVGAVGATVATQAAPGGNSSSVIRCC